jgi:UDP-N-acetylglucosamine--N-acetylmuramyl-(pentapeptide) pyrophosphoryl-undecaprenol N-acetylglucosamine transferase
MSEAEAAIIIPESELTPQSLADLLRDWLQSRAALQERAIRARGLACPDSLSRITEVCLEQAGAVA